tara:strand:+ start:72 stop:461 length:390 start_codon:yes stop_codon:yes gene_type:complete
MNGVSPKLPLHRSSIDGYGMNKSFHEVARQNFKMLILTSPGERVMEPEFGVGIRNFLFENMQDSTYMSIQNRIFDQVQKYMPFIIVRDISFSSQANQQGGSAVFDKNYLGMQITYEIENAGLEVLEFLL